MRCRKEQGGFDRLPAPESLLFAGPKRRNQEKWPHSIRRDYEQVVLRKLELFPPTRLTWRPRRAVSGNRGFLVGHRRGYVKILNRLRASGITGSPASGARLRR